MNMKAPSIALTIMMRNEASVIGQSISAALPFVDAIVVVDTGSTDDSIARAREAIGWKRGTVEQRPWRGFAESRNDALDIAFEHADYSLMIDADSLLVSEPGYDAESLRSQLHGPAHNMHILHGVTKYSRPLLVRRDSGARYKGVVHEFLDFAGRTSQNMISGFHVVNNGAGTSARNRNPRKYFDDAVVLRDALEANPAQLTARYTFYLAQSYLNAGLLRLALETYERRCGLGGWIEEVYISNLAIASLKEKLKFPDHEIVNAYLKAFEVLPTRAESLCELARFAREQNRWNLAHMVAKRGLEIAEPVDALFSDTSVYKWKLRYELSISSWYVRRFAEGQQLCEDLLASDVLDKRHRQTTENNLRLYLDRSANRRESH
jgi:glycosyltransferase involved in cell wall biosynthesis